MSISRELKKYTRLAKGKQSLRQVARDSGVDVATLSKWLAGHRGISDKSIDKLGKYLGAKLVRDKPRRA
jgi:transcriptional regulator with XRE-family HTH domain